MSPLIDAALVAVEAGMATRIELAERLEISRDHAGMLLQRLAQRGRVQRIRCRRRAHYVPLFAIGRIWSAR